MSKRFWTVGLPISIACSLILWAFIFWAVSAFVTTYYLRAYGMVTAINKANATGAASFEPWDTVVLCDSGGPFSPVTDAARIPPASEISGNPITHTASWSPIINGGSYLMTNLSNTRDTNLSISQSLNQGSLADGWEMRYTINANTFSTSENTINLIPQYSSSESAAISWVYIGQRAIGGDALAMQTGMVPQFKDMDSSDSLIANGIRLGLMRRLLLARRIGPSRSMRNYCSFSLR